MATGASFWRKALLIAPVLALGIPVILHVHSGKFLRFYDDGSWLRRWTIRVAFRCAFRVLALTNEWQEWIISVEPRARVQVLMNSLDPSVGVPVSTSIAQCPTVLFLGSVVDGKGVFDLIEAFQRVRRKLETARLIIAGDGDLVRLRHESELRELGDAVEYVGWVDEHTKQDLLRKCWVLALPSYEEGLPMVILEAMAFGRAVVSCPVGGIPEAVEHSVTGLLVAPGNVKALSSAIYSILGDRAFALALGAAGRERLVSYFSNGPVLAQLCAIYRQAGVDPFPQFLQS
jgi:glycosyltransferase involved in cell wall biosynthesis